MTVMQEPAVAPAPVATEPKASPVAVVRPAAFSVSVAYLLMRGWTKGSPGGVAGEVALRLPAQLWLGFGGGYLPPHTASADGASIKTWGGTLQLSLCWQSPTKPWSFLGCVVGGPLFLGARGESVDVSERVHFETGSVGVRVGVRAQLHQHFFGFLSAQGLVPFRQAQLAVMRNDLAEIAYETSPVVGELTVGVGLTY